MSLGGGAITTSPGGEALSGHTVVFPIGVAEGIRRTSGNVNRPLLAGDDAAATYRKLAAARVPLYRRAATVRVSTNRRNPARWCAI